MASKGTLRGMVATWRDGSAGFFRWLEDVKPMIPSEKGGFEPYTVPNEEVREAIRQALDSGFSTVVFCWPRRHGKTVVSALIVAWRFLTRKTQTVAIVANSERQSVDTAFKLVRTILERTPYSKALADEGAIRIGADTITYDALGNVIQGFPTNAASLYGKKLSVAQVSELHAARTDAVYQTLASSTIDSDDGLVLVDSTVGSRSSPLYMLAQVAERGEDPTLFFSHIAYRDLEDAIARGPRWIAPAKLRSRASQMLPAEFAQQHLNQWGSSSSSLFPEAVIEQCKDTYELNPKAITDGRAHVVGGGLDRAYGFSVHGDATVTTAVLKVLDGEDDHYYVMASEGVPFSTAGGIKRRFSRYSAEYGMTKAVIEHYNSQDIGAWCAEQPFDHETIFPTLERQSNAFTTLYNIASEGRLHIHPTFGKLFEEMGTFEHTLEATGTSKGTMPHFGGAKGHHDDYVYSLAWAIYSLRDIELNPYEMNGIHCTARSAAVVRLCVLNGGTLAPPCAEECRSMTQAQALYEQYSSRAGCTKMDFMSFFNSRVTNVGSHTIPR